MKKRSKSSTMKSKKRMPSKKAKGNRSALRSTELLRDLMNLIAVYRKETKQDVTTRIDPDTADELLEKLEQIAKAL